MFLAAARTGAPTRWCRYAIDLMPSRWSAGPPGPMEHCWHDEVAVFRRTATDAGHGYLRGSRRDRNRTWSSAVSSLPLAERQACASADPVFAGAGFAWLKWCRAANLRIASFEVQAPTRWPSDWPWLHACHSADPHPYPGAATAMQLESTRFIPDSRVAGSGTSNGPQGRETIRMKYSIAMFMVRQRNLTVAPQSPLQHRIHPDSGGCQPAAAASTNSEALPPDAVVSAQRLRSQKKEVVPEASVTRGISGPLRLASAMRSFRS